MNMYGVLGNSQAGGPPPAQAPVAQTPVSPSAPPLPTNDDWANRPNEAAQMVAQAQFAALGKTVEQNVQALASQNANTIRALAQQQFASDFQKWGPEIHGHLSQIPPDRLTLDNISKVVTFVRGNHLDEIATERAKQMLATGALGERSGGANGVVVGQSNLEFGKLPADVKALMDKHGMTEDMVRGFCKAQQMTVEQWVSGMNGGQMFTSSSPFEVTMNESKLGINRSFDG